MGREGGRIMSTKAWVWKQQGKFRELWVCNLWCGCVCEHMCMHVYEWLHVSVVGEQLRMKQMKIKEAETNVWHEKDLFTKIENFLRIWNPGVNCHDHICLLGDTWGPEWKLGRNREREWQEYLLEKLQRPRWRGALWELRQRCSSEWMGLRHIWGTNSMREVGEGWKSRIISKFWALRPGRPFTRRWIQRKEEVWGKDSNFCQLHIECGVSVGHQMQRPVSPSVMWSLIVVEDQRDPSNA